MSIYSMKNVQSENTASGVFPVQCNVDNVTLVKAEFEPMVSGNGPGSINFHFRRGGQTLIDKRYAPNLQNVIPKNGETKKQAEERSMAIYNRSIKHICSKFVPIEQLDNVDAESFKEYAAKVCELVNANCNGQLCYLKTILKNNGYVGVSRFPNFIQRMSDGPCTLEYTSAEEVSNKQNEEKAALSKSMSSAQEVSVSSNTVWPG